MVITLSQKRTYTCTYVRTSVYVYVPWYSVHVYQWYSLVYMYVRYYHDHQMSVTPTYGHTFQIASDEVAG
jgi:hypothetical protein